MMSKYNDMLEFYKGEVTRLRDDREFWRDKYIERACQISNMQGKIEIYEKIIRKLLKEPAENDEVFIFEGKVYRPIKHTLSHDIGKQDTLDVTFILSEIKEITNDR